MLTLLDAATACAEMSGVLKILGTIIMIFKIVIPILLIIFGMLDMGKAVTSGKEDEIKKSAMTFMRRAIAAIVIFFVPAIVGLVMYTIDASDGSRDYCACLNDLGLKQCSAKG